MSGPFRRLWNSRDWMLIPLGAVALLALGWWLVDRQATSEALKPQYRTGWAVSRGEGGRGPTVGMTLSEDGYGTVTEAPPVEAPMAPEGLTLPHGGAVASDVAGLIRAWPRETRANPGPDGMTICTLEGPPHYRGKLVLIDGCLRFQPENSALPGRLSLRAPSRSAAMRIITSPSAATARPPNTGCAWASPAAYSSA